MFLGNESISWSGMLQILGALVALYSIVCALLSYFTGFFWRLIWDWPRGRWCLPLVVSFVILVYLWNFYIFRLFLRPEQKAVLIVEMVFFLLIMGLSIRIGEFSFSKVLFRKRFLIIAASSILILITNSVLPTLGTSVTTSSPAQVTPRPDYPEKPVYVFGIDGADWQIMLPMHKMGRVPCLSHIIQTGTIDYLATFDPTSSPLIWTTIATGKGPFEHGIRDFGIYVLRSPDSWISVLPKGAGLRKVAVIMQKAKLWEFRPASSWQWQSRSIWQIANEAGLPVAVNNWPVTLPVGPLNGFIGGETGFYLYHGIQPGEAFFPRSFGTDISATERTPIQGQLTPGDDSARFAIELVSRTWQESDESWHAFHYANRKWPMSLNLFYTHSLDLTQHFFWHYGFREKENARGQGEQFEQAFQMIQRHIVDIDRHLGRFFGALAEIPFVLVVSDHGFRTIYGHERFLNPQSDRVQGVHDYSPPGCFMVHGPGLKHQYLGGLASVFDITPTLLDLLGLPQAADMRGKTLLPMLCERQAASTLEQRVIPTYERSPNVADISDRSQSDRAVEDRLKAIGYIE